MNKEHDLTKITCTSCGHWEEVYTKDVEYYNKHHDCIVCFNPDNVHRIQNTIKCGSCLQVYRTNMPFLHDENCGTVKKHVTKIARPWMDENKFRKMTDHEFYHGDNDTESAIKSQEILRDRVHAKMEEPRNDIADMKDSLQQLVKILTPKEEQVKNKKMDNRAIQ